MHFHFPRAKHDQEFLNLRVRLLASASLRLPLVLLTISLIVCVALKDKVNLNHLLIWVILIQCAAIPRAMFAYWILFRPNASVKSQRDYVIFILFASFTGTTAGLSATLFFPSTSPTEQAFIGMVLTGLVAGGVASSGSSPLVLGAYALTTLLPLGVCWTIYGNDQYHLVIWLTLIFSVIMLMYANDGKKILHESFLIRRQRNEALELLQQKNEEIMLANAAIENLAQTKNRVLAAASHDLRQPLHALSIYSAVLANNPTPNTLKEIGKNIDQLVASLAALLDAMLDLSQLDSHSFPMQTNQTCLAKIAQKVSQEFEHKIQSKNLLLQSSCLPAPVMSDPLILERMLRNLIDNAVKYTSHGIIKISTNVIDGQSIFTLSDSGKGIAHHHLGKIFEEFYQVDNPARDRNQGLGLGLSIVRKMGDLIEAGLTLESTLGVGTTVRLQLPFHPVNSNYENKQSIQAGELTGKTILLVDDEFSIISSMSALIQMWGARALTAPNLEIAFSIAKNEEQIDLVIADLRLKNGESGVTVAQELRRLRGFIPALIISGETAANCLLEVQNRGFHVLQKPIPADQLYLQLLRQLKHI